MNTKPKPFRLPRTRFIKAYAITFKILWRYLFWFTIARFMDPERTHRLFARVHAKSARQIAKTLVELKGLYIKIGQTMSVLSNILPEQLTAGLEVLQDQVPPHPFENIRQRFEADFGAPPETLYARIDPEPIASASLGQVHVAYLKDGTKVAVKLQYPNIEEITQGDLKTIRNIFGIIDFFFTGYNIKAVVEEASQIILSELDYKNEAANIELIASHFKDATNIVFPTVFHELSSQKVLTLSFIEGQKITQLTGNKAPQNPDRKRIATELIHFYCKQVFVHGVYHADPHPGNIIITPDARIAMLDFGAVATVSARMRQGMTLFVEGIIKKDSRLLSQAIRMMGFVARQDDETTLDKVVEYFYSKISGIKIDSFKNLDVTQFQNLSDLIELKKMDVSLSDLTSLFVVPRDWIMLERTMLLMTGLTAQLDETLNPVETVIPYVEKFLLGDDRKKLAEILLSTSKELIISYINLPDDIRKLARKMRTEGLKINATDITRELKSLKRGLSLLATVILASTAGILSYLFYAGGLPEVGFRFEMGAYAFGALVVFMMVRR